MRNTVQGPGGGASIPTGSATKKHGKTVTAAWPLAPSPTRHQSNTIPNLTLTLRPTLNLTQAPILTFHARPNTAPRLDTRPKSSGLRRRKSLKTPTCLEGNETPAFKTRSPAQTRKIPCTVEALKNFPKCTVPGQDEQGLWPSNPPAVAPGNNDPSLNRIQLDIANYEASITPRHPNPNPNPNPNWRPQ